MKKIIAIICAAAVSLSMAACSNENRTAEGGEITTADLAQLETITETAEVSDGVTDENTEAASTAEEENKTIVDREGNTIQIPDSVNTIVSASPAITEILAGLGAADKIIAADLYSADVEGVDPAKCTIDFYNLNVEELAALSPDVIIISGMSMIGAEDPYAALKDAGINVIYVPTSNSIEAVKMDIEFIAAYVGKSAMGAKLNLDIDMAVKKIKAARDAASITEKKKVYFEMGAAPALYSCGKNTFINEVIELVGAENIYATEESWLNNSEESVIAADPDVIITSVMYDGYDFNEIKSRAGWENIKAVKNGAVYQADANAVSRPSQNIIEGMYQIAKAVYPDIYADL